MEGRSAVNVLFEDLKQLQILLEEVHSEHAQADISTKTIGRAQRKLNDSIRFLQSEFLGAATPATQEERASNSTTSTAATTTTVKTKPQTIYSTAVTSAELASSLPEGRSAAGESFFRQPLGSILSIKWPRKTHAPTRGNRRPTQSMVINRRTLVEAEIVDTERTYLYQLNALLKHYLTPLSKKATKFGVLDNKKDSDIFKKLLLNLNAVIANNTSILQQLEDYLVGSCSSDESALLTSIPKIFVEMAPTLKVYGEYIRGYHEASECVQRLLLNAAAKEFLEKVREKLNDERTEQTDMDIHSLLILPVQRIPRYRLLLQELLKYTPREHVDHYYLEKALHKIKQVAQQLNTSNADIKTAKKLLEIQESIAGNYLNLVEVHRSFIHEGPLTAVWDKAEYQFFLFNDLLLYARIKTSIGDKLKKLPTALGSQRSTTALFRTQYQYQGFFLLQNIGLKETSNVVGENTTFELISSGGESDASSFTMGNDEDEDEDSNLRAEREGGAERTRKKSNENNSSNFLSSSTSSCSIVDDEGGEVVARRARYKLDAKTPEAKEKWVTLIKEQLEKIQGAALPSRQTNDIFKQCTHMGFLHKRGEKHKAWKYRFFRLQGNSLFYSADEKATSPLGSIFLPSFSLHFCDAVSIARSNLCFELRNTRRGQRDYFLEAKNEAALTAWIYHFLPLVAAVDEDVKAFLAKHETLLQRANSQRDVLRGEEENKSNNNNRRATDG
ncbi:hypothetical protein QOT17_010581 [Balamuthia mandrillaris]